MRKSFLLSIFFFVSTLSAQTIAEKKAGISLGEADLSQEAQKILVDVNKQISEWHQELIALYDQVFILFQQNASECDYKNLLDQINEIKENISMLEDSWRETASHSGSEEEYSLWHQPNATIEQLVVDYGSQDFVYLMSPEVAAIRVNVNSSLPIPRASWGEMLEIILIQNGIGYRQLNPFLRELYLVRKDNSGIELITNNRHDLDIFPDDARICFVLSPDSANLRRTWLFLDRFINQNNTVMQMIGRDILIFATVGEIRDLLKLYDFVSTHPGDKEYKIIPLGKVDTEEMAKILGAVFEQLTQPPKSYSLDNKGASQPKGSDFGDGGSLKVITLGSIAKAIFLVGTKEEIKRAEEIIRRVEAQVGEARERVIYWYTAKHSNPEELADVLYRIYLLMIETQAGMPPNEQISKRQAQTQQLIPGQAAPGRTQGQQAQGQDQDQDVNVATSVITRRDPPPPPPPPPPPTSLQLYGQSFYQDGGYIINPAPVVPGIAPFPIYNPDRDNFIVDPKTNSIVMVVEADILPKLKEVLRKLDMPKKMVQMEVLFFEKRMNQRSDYGLNLLRIGDIASNTNDTSMAFSNLNPNFRGSPLNTGVTQFFLSRMKCDSGIPAFDYFYRFLIMQEDVQINSAPSVIAVNQTPALIAIKDEISINTGVFEVETAKGVTLKDAFTRSQYGITVSLTPTIHMHSEDEAFEDQTDYVTLDTDITFDTILPRLGQPDRPDVARRQVKNTVRVADGQAVIIGGLRRKIKTDEKQYIPCIGELPGIGKLFSFTGMNDTTTEMFMIITPKIVIDPAEDYLRVRQRQLAMRPGDIPEYMCQLVEAQECEKNRVLESCMRILFGRPCDRCVSTEYDGRY